MAILMKIFLNFPLTLLGLLIAFSSLPTGIHFNNKPPAIIFSVNKLWWAKFWSHYQGLRACAIGNVVILGPNILNRDLEHELVHIDQHMKLTLLYPILYWLETQRMGYRQNKFEKEAYRVAGNPYFE